MKKQTRNIGGSILPSSCPAILTPISCSFGTLQVKPQPESDTHSLFLGDKVIASHPNGYSCHALAERMQKGEDQRVIEQSEYIIRCAGTVNKEAIEEVMGIKFGTIHK